MTNSATPTDCTAVVDLLEQRGCVQADRAKTEQQLKAARQALAESVLGGRPAPHTEADLRIMETAVLVLAQQLAGIDEQLNVMCAGISQADCAAVEAGQP